MGPRYLTLIGMRQGTFHSLSFLDQTLSAEFLPKIYKLFWGLKFTSIGLIWHSDKLIVSYMSLGVAKNEHFFYSHSLCQLGLRLQTRYLEPQTSVKNCPKKVLDFLRLCLLHISGIAEVRGSRGAMPPPPDFSRSENSGGSAGAPHNNSPP